MESFEDELVRIKSEYERREQTLPQDFYSLSYTENWYPYTQRIRKLAQYLRKKKRLPLNDKKILEIGCGRGQWLVDFQSMGAEAKNLYGIELDQKRTLFAKSRIPDANLEVGDAANLPWSENTFDIILQSTVFSSILDVDLKKLVAKQMLRTLKPTGIIIWYDFHYDNPKNPHVKGIRREELRELFIGCDIKIFNVTLAPPLARYLAPKCWILCELLESFKFLNTHYMAFITKPT